MAIEFYSVRNRETLKRLSSGMEITRETKHEPIDFGSLTRDGLCDATDDRNGSKFLSDWTLPVLVEWLQTQVEVLGWRFPPGVQARVHLSMNREVGYASGRLLRTITIMASGRWVHAIPDND